jgi:hypothetical protein
MPQRVTIPFVGGTNRSKAVQVNNQSTVNLVNAVKGDGAKAPVVLESVAGMTEAGSAGNGPCKSSRLVNWQGDLYGVFGTQLVRISTTTGAAVVGTLGASSARAVIARGRDYLMLVDGVSGYTWNGTTFATIADADFPDAGAGGRPTHCAYLDGFFIVNDAETDNFYISAVEDPTSWNALDFEAASAAPDNALAFCTAFSMVYILGDETTQLYYNSGNADFPFAAITSATQEYGILAPDSLAESDDGVFFLATTPEGGRFVVQMIGQSAKIVTGDDQDDILADVEEPELAYGFIFQQHGISFYALQLDDGDLTLVYNITAGVWEERQLQDGSGWRASGHGILAGVNIVGSRLSASFYELRPDVYDDAGEELIRRRVTRIYHKDGMLLDWHQVVIDIEAGVGNDAVPEPRLRLRHTNDQGTWSNQMTARLGASGERQTRCVFNNLGIARAKQIEIEYAEATPFTIIAAYASLSVLDE